MAARYVPDYFVRRVDGSALVVDVRKPIAEQLRLIAGAANYVRAVTRGSFDVRCSP